MIRCSEEGAGIARYIVVKGLLAQGRKAIAAEESIVETELIDFGKTQTEN